MTAPPKPELHATVRIDPAPGAKKFQGVWLEHTDGTRWVIDYRARQLWTWFADQEVVVTGETYSPEGQAINKVHFRVDTMRFVTPRMGRGPYLSIGPERVIAGRFSTASAPAGTKLAGSSWPVFIGDDGTQYNVVGDDDELDATGAVHVKARVLEPDMSYTARSSGPDLWIVSIDDGN
jgi:hypothetical protein